MSKILTQSKWVNFEHQIKKNLVKAGIWDFLRGKHFLVALSGGADSVAILIFLVRFHRILNSKISVLHLHHGEGENIKFRDRAEKFSIKLCHNLSIPIYKKKHKGKKLKSEEDFRNFRIKKYAEVMSEINADFVALGHHGDDLLETRLMRLIRGVGPTGLESMKVIDNNIFRPFLIQNREQILEYLAFFNQDYVEDPSNKDRKYFRNWIRHSWLKSLEQHYPGSKVALARSLQDLANMTGIHALPDDLWTENGISRLAFASLSYSQKCSALVDYLKSIGIRSFRQTQLEEIIKLLDKSQNEYTFNMLKLGWFINAEQISARPI